MSTDKAASDPTASDRAASDPFSAAYAAGDLGAFFARSPGDLQAALSAPRTTDRPALVTALKRYATKLGAPEAVHSQLENLAHPESRAVVTGQQAGLLLGPSYTLSKAVTALRLADEVSSEARPVVPIFWVASQDHDSDEIDHSYLLDLDETLHRLELPLPGDVPAGRITLQAQWLEALAKDLGHLNVKDAYRDEVLHLLRDSAAVSETYADWFAALLYRLLGEHGLIVLNPLEPDIAPLFAGILAAELADPAASSAAITEAGQALSEQGFTPQLGRGEAASNLFLETEKRKLLRYDREGFYTEDETYTREALLELLEREPSRLTPAAGLRPITQDAALPTAVTVVGPGELRYFAQLKGVYAHHEVAMPLIWPRMSATVLEPPVTRMLAKFDVSYAELAAHFSDVKDAKLLELHGHKAAFDEALGELETAMQELTRHVKAIDPTLEGSLGRGEGYLHKTLDIFKTKSARALEHQDSVYARQFGRLEQQLFPLGQPQERLLSPFSFFLKFGVEAVVKAFLALPSSGQQLIRF